MLDGIEMIAAGIMICMKREKSEWELEVSKSFKRVMLGLIIPMIIFIIVLGIWLVPEASRSLNGDGKVYSSYIKRTGHVEDGQVRYVQGINKYISLESLNISSEEVEEGDKIILFFNSADELVFGKSAKKYDNELNKSLGMLFGFMAFFVVFYVIFGRFVRNHIGAVFLNWYNSYYRNYT